MKLASLVLPLPGCVTVGMLLNLSVLPFSDLQNEIRGGKPGTWKALSKSECPFFLPPKATASSPAEDTHPQAMGESTARKPYYKTSVAPVSYHSKSLGHNDMTPSHRVNFISRF